MNQSEIVNFAESKGAHVSLNNFGDSTKSESICVYVQEDNALTGAIKSWKHAIFIDAINDMWKIGFSQSASTQALDETKLKELLSSWINEPSDDIFKPYERT